MVEKTLKNFDLEQIAHSGQCFRMKQTGGCRFEVVAYGKRLIIRQSGEQVTFFCTEREYNDLWRRYFDIETNYRYYIDHIDPEDGFLTAAARLGGGIRILRQDLWEVLVSFIISQNNSIPRITASIETLCRTCGKKHLAAPEGVAWWEFPGPEALADEANLEAARLGYRAKYVAQLAQNVMDGTVDLEALAKMDQESAGNYLKAIYGVGAKVASCVQLFGLHQLDSFPVDTWMKQVIHTEYGGKFPAEAYSGFMGVIQQYMFYYARRRAAAERKKA